MKSKKKQERKQVYKVSRDQLIIRDHLAADRTALANERTFLAYIRTALAFIAGGFGLIKFVPTLGYVIFGWILVVIGVIILIIGIIRFIQFRKTIGELGCAIYQEEQSRNTVIEVDNK
ncbi:MAG: DUF202 domain-containing protein [Asgard group archaeon]|nr:DUF202 domain-containing protein [Asgard group archaeon]